MEPEFKDLEAFRLIGLEGSFDPSTAGGIPPLWAQFSARYGEIEGQIGKTSYGLSRLTDRQTGAFDYMAGVATAPDAPVPEGMSEALVPGGRYAVFTHVVGDEGMQPGLMKTFQHIFGVWLPQSGYAPAEFNFELYDERLDPQTMQGAFDIYVPAR